MNEPTPARVCILMPMRDRPTAETLYALEHNTPPHTLLTVTGKPVDEARNELVLKVLALEPAPDVVLWVDADAWWPRGTIGELAAALKNRPEFALVAGYYYVQRANAPEAAHREVRSGPHAGMFAPPLPFDADRDGLVEVVMVGGHCMVHRLDLLRKLGPSPFAASGDDTETGAFCKRIVSSGSRIACHTRAVVAHVNGVDGSAFVPYTSPLMVRENRLVAIPAGQRIAPTEVRQYGLPRDARRKRAPRPVRVLESW